MKVKIWGGRGDGGTPRSPPRGERVLHLGKRGETRFPEFTPKGGRGEMFPQEFPRPRSVGEREGVFPTLGDASSWNTGKNPWRKTNDRDVEVYIIFEQFTIGSMDQSNNKLI